MGIFGGRKTNKARKAAPATIGLFGKHPSAGDFLRVNASSTEVRAFDQWLSGSISRAERSFDEWKEIYQRATASSFLFHAHWQADNPRCLLGTLVPSRDQAGRLFPLALFAEIDARTVDVRYPALPHHPFLQDLRSMLGRRERLTQDELASSVQRVRVPDDGGMQRAYDQHADHLERSTLGSALAPIFDGAPSGLRERALSLLRSACGPARDPRNLPRYGLRCPLGRGGPSAAALWLELFRASIGTPIMPNVLWNDEAVVIFFSRLSSKALMALWLPSWQDDNIFDIASDDPTVPTAELALDQPLNMLLTR